METRAATRAKVRVRSTVFTYTFAVFEKLKLNYAIFDQKGFNDSETFLKIPDLALY